MKRRIGETETRPNGDKILSLVKKLKESRMFAKGIELWAKGDVQIAKY